MSKEADPQHDSTASTSTSGGNTAVVPSAHRCQCIHQAYNPATRCGNLLGRVCYHRLPYSSLSNHTHSPGADARRLGSGTGTCRLPDSLYLLGSRCELRFIRNRAHRFGPFRTEFDVGTSREELAGPTARVGFMDHKGTLVRLFVECIRSSDRDDRSSRHDFGGELGFALACSPQWR